jgi:hypothetical protein
VSQYALPRYEKAHSSKALSNSIWQLSANRIPGNPLGFPVISGNFVKEKKLHDSQSFLDSPSKKVFLIYLDLCRLVFNRVYFAGHKFPTMMSGNRECGLIITDQEGNTAEKWYTYLCNTSGNLSV